MASARAQLASPLRWFASFGALAAIVLAYRYWLHVNAITVGITLLLLVLLLSAEWGLVYASAIAVAAAACLNFFFLPPVGTFIISDPQNWLALFAFLGAAIIASRQARRVKQQATEAQQREAELEQLFRFSTLVLQMGDVAGLVSNIPHVVMEATRAPGAEICLHGVELQFRAGELSAAPLEIPLRTGVRERGILKLHGIALSADSARALGGLVALAMDHAEALEKLSREEAAKERERFRGVLSDSITHALRTPLTAIKGAVTTLLNGTLPAGEAHELLEVIDEESDHLNGLVTEAAEVAQLDARDIQLDLQTVPVAALVQATLSACAWVNEEHGVAVDVPADLQVRCDGDVLVRALINLVENAAKYSAPGTEVRIRAQAEGRMAAITVEDDGMGIAPQDQELVFERFYRVATPGRRIEGTGMGLAICRAIVEAHGGSVRVESTPGVGSRFTVLLPRAS